MSAPNWLKAPPRKPPPEPETVNLQHLLLDHAGRKSRGMDYIRAKGPKQTLDQWGQPLPLSAVAQYDLDRMVAILKEPLVRTRALLLSGLLNPDEVDAVKSVHPEIYDLIRDAALNDMVQTKPPYRNWAVNVLGVLFQKPATQAYSDAQHNDPAGAGAAMPGIPGAPGGPRPSSPTGFPGSIPTPSDRLEPAVRELSRS